MKSRTRIILLLGFGTLLALLALMAVSALWKAEQFNEDMARIHDSYRQTDAELNGIYADVDTASILVRDFLLDPRIESMAQYRQELAGLRASMEAHLDRLRVLAGNADSDHLDRLHNAMKAYWASRDSVFDWTPQQRAQQGFNLLSNVIPHRQAVILLTREINDLNAANLQKEREKISQSQADFRRYMGGVFVIALSLALFVAGFSYQQILKLERVSEQERRRIENAERELRSLSQKLVQAQEDERSSISRELHDEIGQMLTGLRLELGNLERIGPSAGPEFKEHLGEGKELAERALRSVRDLALGLRPSMLDDLGLEPALRWQAREFSRRNGIPASVEIQGEIEDLSDRLRTCVYRVVQESLTNCARHARAKNVFITLRGGKGCLTIRIKDDGVGFDRAGLAPKGIGLIGMDERVRELGGNMSLESRPNQGTLLEISIPIVHNCVS